MDFSPYFVSYDEFMPRPLAIFSAWLMSRKSTVEELGLGDSRAYQAWRFAVRYIAPFGVIIIFLNAIGFFKLLGFGE